MSRRASREIALRALFQVDLVKICPEAALTAAWEDLPDSAVEFARSLLTGTLKHLPMIDEAIGRIAKEWSVDRMPTADRNILRIAVYEIMYCEDIPDAAAINEAVELAKSYGTADSPRFVNGVLASILTKKEMPSPPSK